MGAEREDQLQHDLFALISEMQGIKLEKIAVEKSLNFDLGVDGDDAVELFQAYAQKFQVDLTPLGEEWDRYFGQEGIDILSLFSSMSWPLGKRRKPMRPLPVSRLLASARAGRWIPLAE